MAGMLTGYNKNWTANYTIPTAVPDGTYTARFTATNPSGKQEVKTCTYTVTHNRPPTVAITGTNPSFIYEGDDVTLNFTVNDPDLQLLNCNIKIMKGAATIWTGTRAVSPSGGVYPAQSILTALDITTGSYTAQVTATDPYNSSATANYNFYVSPLGITGHVGHTPEWEVNRQKYNNAAEAAGREIHPEDTFFAGEKYILHANTTAIDPQSTVRANTVNVYIIGTSFSTQLVRTGENTFDGDLWDASMLRWDDRIVDFLFEVTYSNGTVKTDTVRTYIKDDEYWRLHLEF